MIQTVVRPRLGSVDLAWLSNTPWINNEPLDELLLLQ